MRWRGRRQSDNVEDRRGAGMPRGMVVGGAGGLGLLLLVVVASLLGVDPTQLLQDAALDTSGPVGLPGEPAAPGVDDEGREFVTVVLADTEDVWNTLFADSGAAYAEPGLVLFHGAVRSGCGTAGSAVGPFYCPADSRVYIDLQFYDDLRSRFGAPGDFAQAYVIAHEVGHHVQNLLGVSSQVDQARSSTGEAEGNRLSVMLELQADCLAGVWAHHAERMQGILEAGDVEEALGAAAAIGDDRLQRRAQGHVVPESFTHGTSEQRVRWFERGLTSGDSDQCNTFSARAL